jgi:uncharacterized membrane protein
MPTPAQAFSLGRALFGLALIGSGLLQLVHGEFIRLVPERPVWLPAPAHAGLVYLIGFLLVALGAAILSGRLVTTAATILAALLLFDVLVIYPPSMFANPQIDRPLLRGFMYTNPLKCLALIGGAAMLAGRLPDRMRGLAFLGRGVGKWQGAGAALLAAFLVVCGLQHFAYREFVTLMVPEWLPERRFWTYFTGVALVAGGTGLLLPRTARLAASLSALMIFLWVVMLHLPRAVALPNHAFETAGVFEALALSGVALVVAGSRQGPV